MLRESTLTACKYYMECCHVPMCPYRNMIEQTTDGAAEADGEGLLHWPVPLRKSPTYNLEDTLGEIYPLLEVAYGKQRLSIDACACVHSSVLLTKLAIASSYIEFGAM